ncbi:GNAT family N-acetyltransferase [Methylobacterium sp. M6A4_1b]
MTRRSDEDLAWAVEEACRNARPSPLEIALGGWMLRASGGPTRRTNSLNPLRGWRDDPAVVVAEAETVYRGLGQPLIVRVPDLVPEMDLLLDDLGYRREGETCTLYAELATRETCSFGEVRVSAAPDAAWLTARAACEGVVSEAASESYSASLACLILPRLFVRRIEADVTVAVAYGSVHRGILVFESVATHPAHRRAGHARSLILALMAWARGRGATGACLQVVAGNAPARALYAGLGFSRGLYGYRYRRRD